MLSDRFVEGFTQLGNVAEWIKLDARKVSKNIYFGKEFKKHLMAKIKLTSTFTLLMMKFSVTFITLTLTKLSLIAGKYLMQCGRS